MSKEKQNNELVQMYRDLSEIFDEEYEKRRLITSQNTAEKMTAKGYRKQSEGEWIDADPNGHLYRFTCSLCGKTKLGIGTPYCPNCGAHMKGGEDNA